MPSLLTRIQSFGPTPSTVIVSKRLLSTNFIAEGLLLVAIVTGTCQSIDSNPVIKKVVIQVNYTLKYLVCCTLIIVPSIFPSAQNFFWDIVSNLLSPSWKCIYMYMYMYMCTMYIKISYTDSSYIYMYMQVHVCVPHLMVTENIWLPAFPQLRGRGSPASESKLTSPWQPACYWLQPGGPTNPLHVQSSMLIITIFFYRLVP